MIESNIDNIATIDAGFPFLVDISSNGKTESVILLRVNEYDKQFMNEVETVFDHWDLIMSQITQN